MTKNNKFLFLTLIFIFSCSNHEFDILIVNGTIVDGSGLAPYKADIGIIDDRITQIGNLSNSSGKHTIDALNLTVSPGFIDSHTHAVRGIFDVPTAESSILQGVTTLTEGNDGTSPYPIDEHYKAIKDAQITPNWSVFVGQGTIRRKVMGMENRNPTKDELALMRSMARQAMEDGALGISTGLFYVPGSFSTT